MSKESTPQAFWELIVQTEDNNQKYMSFETREEAEKYCIDNGWGSLAITKVVFHKETSFGFNVFERVTYYGAWGRITSYIKLLPDGEAFYDDATGWCHYADEWSELGGIYYQFFGEKAVSPLLSKSELIFSRLGVSDDCYDTRYKPYIYSDQAIEYIKKNSKTPVIIVEYYPKYGKYNEVLRISEYGRHRDSRLVRKSGNTWISLQHGYSLDKYKEHLPAIGWFGTELADEFYRAFIGKTSCLSVENGSVSECFFAAAPPEDEEHKHRGKARCKPGLKQLPMFKRNKF